jgi:hypothetical protein
MEKPSQQFGLLVAYLVPGFVGLAGLALLVPTVARWLQPPLQADLGIGPPVYAVLAAMTVGMIISCVRWLLVDHAHHLTGLVPPLVDADQLEARLHVFNYFVEYHYRYYQFYANTLIAVVWTYALNRWRGTSPLLGVGTDLGIFILCLVLFAGSRDALAKYYSRTERLVGRLSQEERSPHDKRLPQG